MKNKFWKNINYNKWNKDVPDCFIRSICAGIGVDYEAACRVLGVDYVKGEGCLDMYGVDLEVFYDRFKPFFGKMEDILDKFEDPQKAITSITLNQWLEEHKDDNCVYIVYLDDFKQNDGGHIVCARCNNSSTYFIDTFDCGNMYV